MSFERTIHSFKTAIACLLGLIIAQFLHVGAGQWIVITILVVMCAQINVGSMLQKSYLRFLGTLTGSLLAALTLELFGANPLVISIVIILAAWIFSYIATGQKSYSDAGTLGAATTAIILLVPEPTLLVALTRCLEITLGIVIAALVSQFVLPIHAGFLLRRNQAETIRQLRDYYETLLIKKDSGKGLQLSLNLDEAVVGALIKQRKLAKEASQELIGKNFNFPQFNHALWCEKEILRAITYMHHALNACGEIKHWIISLESLKVFNQNVITAFNKIAENIEKKNTVEITLPDLTYLKADILRENPKLSADNAIYTNSFLFCAEELIARMKKLIKIISQN